MKELYEKARIERQQKNGTIYQKQYSELYQQLHRRVANEMKNMNIPSLKEYQNAVVQLEQDGKVMRTRFYREYYIPSKNPYSRYYKMEFYQNKNGELELARPHSDTSSLIGTSYATPQRAARLALDKMLEGVL